MTFILRGGNLAVQGEDIRHRSDGRDTLHVGKKTYMVSSIFRFLPTLSFFSGFPNSTWPILYYADGAKQ